MGEVERVRASFGASFGNYGARVTSAADRNAKKHHQQHSEHHAKDDALELHDEGSEPAAPHIIHLADKPEDHLDLSA